MDKDYGFYDSIDDESLDEQDYTTDEYEEYDELDFLDDMDDDDESDSDWDDTDEESLDEQDSTIDEYEEDDELDFLDDMEDEEESDSYLNDTDDESDLEDVVDDTKVVSGHINEIPTEHLPFKEIPICGNVYSFANSLRKKGYSIDEKAENIADSIKSSFQGDSIYKYTMWMRGQFAGNTNCNVSLHYTPKTHTTYEVEIWGRDFNSPSTLIDEYIAMCSAFTNKYGECYECVKSSVIENLHSFQEIDECDISTVFAFRNSSNSELSCIRIEMIISEERDYGLVSVLFRDGEGKCLYENEKNVERYKKSDNKVRRYIDLDDI